MNLVGCAILLSILPIAATSLRDTLTISSPLYDGETLISAGGVFALGFFSPDDSSGKRYVAIWYHNIPSHDVVWVANARSPVAGRAGSLALTPRGTLVVFDRNNTAIWSSPSTAKTTTTINPTAQLLDTGNLIVRDDIPAGSDDNNYIWQSFDYPSDTMLPGMVIGWDLRRGLNRNLTSWTSPTDPSPGEYTTAIDLSGVPQVIITQGHSVYFRGGPWIENTFVGTTAIHNYEVFKITFVTTTEEVGYYYEPVIGKASSMRKIYSNGTAQRFTWIDPPGQWSILLESLEDQCDQFSICGPFGTCNASVSPYCSCLWGFRPKNPARWVLSDWRDGCVRKTNLDCRNGKGTDGFLAVSGVKLPDTSSAVADASLGPDECRMRCLTNCSCTAYAKGGVYSRKSGCIMWAGQLNDMRFFSTDGYELFVRLAATDVPVVDTTSSQTNHKRKRIVAIMMPIMGGILILLISCQIAHHNKRIRKIHEENDEVANDKDIDLPLFDFETIVEATNNFSDENKLGEGGFGPVYKEKRWKRDSCEKAFQKLKARDK